MAKCIICRRGIGGGEGIKVRAYSASGNHVSTIHAHRQCMRELAWEWRNFVDHAAGEGGFDRTLSFQFSGAAEEGTAHG